LEREICSLWEWILFFQHERLIHLLVTILFALLTFGSLVTFLVTEFLPVIALFVLFLALLIPYIFHYYHLENGVQQLYDLYDQLKALREDKQNG
jgi:Ca2+/Na+ antiporter